MKIKLNYYNFLLLCIVAVGISLRIIFFFISDIGDEEAAWRVIKSAAWVENLKMFIADSHSIHLRDLIPGNLNFGPLHFMFVSIFIYLLKQWIIAAKLLNLLFSFFFLFIFYRLLRTLFKEEKKNLIMLWFLATYSLHIKHSILTTSVVIFNCFLFLSLFIAIKCPPLQHSNKTLLLYVIFSALSLNLAGMTRFEGWLYIPLFSLFIYNSHKKYGFLFLVLSMLFPFIYMSLSYFYTESLLSFYQNTAQMSLTTTSNLTLLEKIFSLPSALAKTLTIEILLLSIIGLYTAWRKSSNQIKLCLYSVLLVFIIFFLSALKGTVNFNLTRYTLVIGLFLLIFAGMGIITVTDAIKSPAIRKTILFLFLLGNFLHSLVNLNQEKENLRFSVQAKTLILWIKENCTINDKIVFYNIDESPIVALYALKRIDQFYILSNTDYQIFNLTGMAEQPWNTFIKEKKARCILVNAKTKSLNDMKYEKSITPKKNPVQILKLIEQEARKHNYRKITSVEPATIIYWLPADLENIISVKQGEPSAA